MDRRLYTRCAAAALCAAMALGLTACGGGTEEIRFGTGGTAGTYYSYGTALAELVEGDLPDAAFDVKSTAGSAANLRLLSEGFLQLAFVQNDALYGAYTAAPAKPAPAGSDAPAAVDADQTYSAVAALYLESCQIVVPADSGIASVFDLRGRTVSVGEEESGVLQNADQILLAHGLTRDMLTPRYLSFAAAAEAMREGEIDAMFLTAGAPTSAVENLAEEMAVRVVGLDADVIADLSETYAFYSPCAIPAGTYPGQSEAVETVGVKSVLVASDALSIQTVEALTASIFAHGADLQYSTPGSTRPELEFAAQGVSIPFHPGAANYYAAQGVGPASAEAENVGGAGR